MTAVLSSITERCIPKTKAVLNVFSLAYTFNNRHAERLSQKPTFFYLLSEKLSLFSFLGVCCATCICCCSASNLFKIPVSDVKRV